MIIYLLAVVVDIIFLKNFCCIYRSFRKFSGLDWLLLWPWGLENSHSHFIFYIMHYDFSTIFQYSTLIADNDRFQFAANMNEAKIMYHWSLLLLYISCHNSVQKFALTLRCLDLSYFINHYWRIIFFNFTFTVYSLHLSAIYWPTNKIFADKAAIFCRQGEGSVVEPRDPSLQLWCPGFGSRPLPLPLCELPSCDFKSWPTNIQLINPRMSVARPFARD
jgi:hypothetical protein